MAENKLGKILVGIGVLLVLVATVIFVQNLQAENHAKTASADVVLQLEQEIVKSKNIPEASDLELELFAEVDGIASVEETYMGILEIPDLALYLPVQQDWSYAKLLETPCVLSGTIAEGDLILMGHNYQAHFGNLKNLSMDAEVHLQDMEGVVFSYTVSEIEVIEEDDLDALNGGDWDLTLVTCDASGRTKNRVIVRLHEK